MRIYIVNPNAKKILLELAELNLINIRSETPLESFELLLSTLRRKKKSLTLHSITKQVEVVRAKRYAK